MSTESQNAQASISFPFLTPERAKAFEEAVQSGRRLVTEYIQNNPNTYWAMPTRERSNWRRSIYVGELNRVLGAVEDVTVRSDNGGFFLVFDGDYVVHPKKLNRKTLQAWIPRILQPVEGDQQLPLDGFINEENVPLNQLQDFVAGFVENELGELVAFYFTEQDGQIVVNKLPVDVTIVVPFYPAPPVSNDIPEVKFKAKKKRGNDESTGS